MPAVSCINVGTAALQQCFKLNDYGARAMQGQSCCCSAPRLNSLRAPCICSCTLTNAFHGVSGLRVCGRFYYPAALFQTSWQTPSTGLRHRRCRKAMLGMWLHDCVAWAMQGQSCCCNVPQLNNLRVTWYICNCTLANTFHGVGGLLVWPFLLPRHIGIIV